MIATNETMAYLAERNPKLDPRYAGVATIYMKHGEQLGIRWDYAFFQMMLETGSLSYTHRLFGEVDFQLRGYKSWLNYGYSEATPARQDTVAGAAAGFGYNLKNRTRISLNYEVSERRSPAFPGRNFERTRVYLSWAYAF